MNVWGQFAINQSFTPSNVHKPGSPFCSFYLTRVEGVDAHSHIRGFGLRVIVLKVSDCGARKRMRRRGSCSADTSLRITSPALACQKRIHSLHVVPRRDPVFDRVSELIDVQ
ncbi:hypothetical protein SAY86_007695 [Trapa natans]|uniref:Uncharacterized protein n=1 Tax=Trapa natans TaxID=22666 RepID=A0AAN7LM76_TRANT|nr:hypothetical protein SAY86_007695 [Trapa natans]